MHVAASASFSLNASRQATAAEGGGSAVVTLGNRRAKSNSSGIDGINLIDLDATPSGCDTVSSSDSPKSSAAGNV